MLRLNENLEKKLVTDIEILRSAFPGTVPPSVVDKEESKCKGSVSESTSHGPVTLGDGIGVSFNRVPLTKESLDLMDTPIPSGLLAEEFAYHGFAPLHVKELHQAHQLLDEIYTEIKRYSLSISADNLIDTLLSEGKRFIKSLKWRIPFNVGHSNIQIGVYACAPRRL